MNDLEELKSLLFGAEKQTLESLDERVRKPETRAVDIADVLPEAVRLSHRNGTQLTVELREPVRHCLQESIRETPQEYADALYPVMGPAIRKSIVETLKAFVEQISRAAQHSLSVKGLKWRVQAAREGIPFGEFVLQKSLLYRVEQAYLTSRKNGLLVAHVHHEASRIKDSDAVSAMFTAIQDFVKESFSPDRTGRLEVADMGEFSLWAVHGPHALLVCVIRGIPPAALRADMNRILERIHFRFGDAIRSYNGDTETMQGVEDELNECLQFQAQHEVVQSKSRTWIPLLAILLVVGGLVAYFGYQRWSHNQQYDRLARIAGDIQGIHVSGIDFVDGKFMLHGLRDPLATTVTDIAASAGLSEDQLASDLRPYRSLDPEIIRVRAHELLAVPAGVSLVDTEDGITLSGLATQQWIDALQTKIVANALDMNIETADLESTEWLNLKQSASKLNGAQFRFYVGKALLLPEEAIRLQSYAAELKEISGTATELGGTINFEVTGFTDAPGGVEVNTTLSRARAGAGTQALIDEGISDTSIRMIDVIPSTPSEESNPNLRRVTIAVSIERK